MACCCCGKSQFLKEFFGTGSNAGSIIFQGIEIFKTFQRISAPKSFAFHFSHKCFHFFRWAIDLVKSIIGLSKPVSNLHLFCMFTFVLPLTILSFICTMILRKKIYLYFIIVVVCTAFGLGIKLCEVHLVAGLPILLISFIIIIFIIYKVVTMDKSQLFDMDENSVDFNLTFTILNSFFIFYLTVIPIMAEHFIFGLLLFIISSLGIIILPLAESCCNCCNKCKKKYDSAEDFCLKSLSFANHLLPLFIIPSTDYLFDMVQKDKIKIWNLILGYVVISLIFPFFYQLLMIFSNNPNLASKYKKTENHVNKYYFFELGDIFKQIIYAIFAGYDIIWGCIFIEIIWDVLISIFRPYSKLSEYFFSILNSIFITISNSIILYSNYHNVQKFPFKIAIIAVAIVCIPAIVSIYIYFIFDFQANDKNDDDEEIEHSIFLSSIIVYIAPVIWAFYGLNAWTTYTGC